jgi:hypothetical protein
MSDKAPLYSASLEAIIDRGKDYPLAYLAALQLKPLMDDLANGFKQAPGAHSSAVDSRSKGGITPDIMHTVKTATMQLQEHLFDLQKLAIEHPDQKEHIQEQIEETRLVSGALVEAVSMITRFNDMSHPAVKAAGGGKARD